MQSSSSLLSHAPSAWRWRAALTNRYGVLFLFATIYLIRGLVLRTALAILSESMLEIDFPDYVQVVAVGFLMDVVACGWILLPGTLYLSVLPHRWLSSKPHKWFMLFAFLGAVIMLLFGSASEWLFWEEFESRFNFIAVDYLVYTTEVVDNILESYPIPLILTGIVSLAGLGAFACRGSLRLAIQSPRTKTSRLLPLSALILVPVTGRFLIQSTGTSISENRYANELVKNGEYSLVAAFFGNVLDYCENYKSLPPEVAQKRTRELLEAPTSEFVSSNIRDLTRITGPKGATRKFNVILVTIESLSASLVGCLGSEKNLTPEFDRLAQDGLLFTNIFATGSRTVRGLEALSLSIPPTPGRSILKRPHHESMRTIGHIFRENGYRTKFAYGGYGYFDGMTTFFKNNGYGILDRSDISEEQTRFSNAWGVCDEDLYEAVVRDCDASAATGQPFFMHVMTTSNHRPYTYPEVIDIPSGTNRYGAVKYSDHAIGSFIELAKTKPWFNKTLFVFVADHCASSAGKRQLNLAKHHIPLLVYAPGIIEPGVNDELGSQIDVGPTLFGLLDFTLEAPFFGQDLLSPGPRRAFIGNYQSLGLYDGNRMVVLSPKRQYSSYLVDKEFALAESETITPFLNDGISLYQSACALYGQSVVDSK